MTFHDHWQWAERRVEGWNLRYQPWESKPVLPLAVVKLVVALWTWLRGAEPPPEPPAVEND